MLAQNYDNIQNNPVYSFGDNLGYPFDGPLIRLSFLDNNTLAVIGKDKEIYIQKFTGAITEIVIPSLLKSTSQRKTTTLMNTLANQSVIHAKNVKNLVHDEDSQPLNDVSTLKCIDLFITDIYVLPNSFLPPPPVDMAPAVRVENSISKATSKSIAERKYFVTDVGSNSINILNHNDWSVELKIGQKGSHVGSFEQPYSLSCLQIHTVTYFITLERLTSRIQVLNAYGNPVAATSTGTGSDPGYFNSPTSIATHLPTVFRIRDPVTLHEPITADWYLGAMEAKDLLARLESSKEPGSMFLGHRPNDKNVFDIVYMLDYFRVQTDTMYKLANGRILLGSDDTFPSKDSVWALLRGWKTVRKGSDRRPYALIAVADTENSRVQIFKFYWTESPIFAPEIRLYQVIGGVRKAGGHKLVRPVSVAYSGSGDLAICDESAHKIIVLAQHTSIVLKEIRMYFVVPYNPLIAKTKQSDTPDTFPCAVAYSEDGKLAVGYRRGGVYVFPPYRNYKLGSLEALHTYVFEIIISFCGYREGEQLRNSCWCLHNVTRALHRKWAFHPMRGEAFHAQAVYLFVKWCRLEGGDGVNVGPLLDSSGKELCRRHLTRLRGKGCGDRYCQLSHGGLHLDYKVLDTAGACLELKCLELVVTELCSPLFLWQYERNIHALFTAFSTKRIMVGRKDPMTRAHELVREEIDRSYSVIGIREFLKILTMCEEAFTGAKPFSAQQIFGGGTGEQRRPSPG